MHDVRMKRLVHQLRLLFIAIQFLTRLPVPSWVGFEPAWLQACLPYFPVVGALVGLGGAAVMAAAAAWWPPVVAVVLSMAFTVWMTGGFHEDGLADTCDALGGAVSREKALDIMKDSRIGSYGSLALILMLGLKAAVLTSLLTPLLVELDSAETSHIREVLLAWTAMGLIWCHAASRLVPVLLIRFLPYAGDLAHAKAKPLAMRTGSAGLVGAAISTLLVAGLLCLTLYLQGWPVSTLQAALWRATLFMAVGALVCGQWFMRRLNGFTGDTLGASQQITEVLGLLAWLQVVHPVA
jgi:adenosylcobinamide-GDP ribazoletransferase